MLLYALTSSRTCTAVVNAYLGAFIFSMYNTICHVCAIGSTNMLHMEQVAATLPGSVKMPQVQRLVCSYE